MSPSDEEIADARSEILDLACSLTLEANGDEDILRWLMPGFAKMVGEILAKLADDDSADFPLPL